MNDEFNFDLNFPIAKNVFPKLLADDIKPMTSEEVGIEMGKLFEMFEKLTGKQITIKGNELPVNVLFPEKYKTKKL
jgi:hypothetical protein